MSKDLNIGNFSEVVNDKMDRDANNAVPPLTGLIQILKDAGASFVIKSELDPDDPTRGYRIWSDGYCEQWGIAASGDTITLVKSYKDTNFNVQHSLQYSETSANANAAEFVILANNQIRVSRYTPNIGTGTIVKNHWRTCGYLAEGEY